MKYSEKLKDPRWQKKRLEIFERDEWTCVGCGEKERMLVVHHRRYLPGKEPWQYPDNLLITLCDECHKLERELREEAESQLVDLLKDNFLTEDILTLCEGLSYLKRDPKDVLPSALSWVFGTHKAQEQLIKLYLKKL